MKRLLQAAVIAAACFGVYVGGREAYNGVRYVHQAHLNAQAGAQAFNYLASPVKLPDGREVALGDILAQMAKAAAANVQPAKAEAGK